VLLSVFAAAALCVAAVAVIFYANGLRYMKSDGGVKFFGSWDSRSRSIESGRLWAAGDAADVSAHRHFIVGARDADAKAALPGHELFLEGGNFSPGRAEGILQSVNSAIPASYTDYFPMNNFLFNRRDDRILPLFGEAEVIIKDREAAGNHIRGGEFYASDGTSGGWVKWVLSPKSASPSSHRDFEVVQEGSRSRSFKGSIFGFLEKERVFFASLEFRDGEFINLYAAPEGMYRISYEKGPKTGDLYFGPLDGGFLIDGFGLCVKRSGAMYIGGFSAGEMTGEGEFLFSSGDIYKGAIKDGLRHGEGAVIWHDGASYTGGFYENMRSGFGRDVFADGSVYEGGYENDVKSGRGKFVWASGDVYEGEFRNDLYSGRGRYAWASGDFYEGEFRHNTLHGWGTYYWASGRKYTGWFSHGRLVLEKPDDVE